jgi:hypothetical protein
MGCFRPKLRWTSCNVHCLRQRVDEARAMLPRSGMPQLLAGLRAIPVTAASILSRCASRAVASSFSIFPTRYPITLASPRSRANAVASSTKFRDTGMEQAVWRGDAVEEVVPLPGRRRARFGQSLTKTDERSAKPSTEKTRLASATSSYVILLTPSVATTRALSEERCLLVVAKAWRGLWTQLHMHQERVDLGARRRHQVASSLLLLLRKSHRIAFAPMREALLFCVALGHASARRVLHPSVNQALCKAQARASLRALNDIADASADNASSKPH